MGTTSPALLSELAKLESLGKANPTLAAEAAIENALNFCARQMKLTGPQAALDQLRQGEQHADGYFRYALAHQVAGYLAFLDNEIKSVYLYEEDATPEDMIFGSIASPVHLLVWAQRKTEAFNALFASLDRALGQCYADRAGLAPALHMLDAQLLDDADVRGRRGYAALLTSIHHPPVLIWER